MLGAMAYALPVIARRRAALRRSWKITATGCFWSKRRRVPRRRGGALARHTGTRAKSLGYAARETVATRFSAEPHGGEYHSRLSSAAWPSARRGAYKYQNAAGKKFSHRELAAAQTSNLSLHKRKRRLPLCQGTAGAV